MLIAVLATDEQWEELLNGCDETLFVRIDGEKKKIDADGYIILDERTDAWWRTIQKPVLFNSVTKTLSNLNATGNVVRVNGWNGFIQRKTWEISGIITEEVKELFTAIGRQVIEVADEPGLVAARVVSMIINEAYFALGENVSTKAEIDTAMKLGTNYPYGPFEWADKIGIHNIYGLLEVLGNTSKRYTPALLLQNEATT
jgi:3-hydroxybutyryl-CoA dehydrogenase